MILNLRNDLLKNEVGRSLNSLLRPNNMEVRSAIAEKSENAKAEELGKRLYLLN